MRVKAKDALVLSGYAMALAWLNLYICRELFLVEYTGHMNSMQGFWIALARLAKQHWVWPTWWPYWDSGTAFEYTYAPLIPGLTALSAAVTGLSHPRAFNIISGVIYCLAPITLFLMASVLTRSPGYSFAAACIYSLISPTALLAPDERLSLAHFWDCRTLYLVTVWDEAPHLAALALLPLCILFLYLSLEKRRPLYYLCAIASMSLTMLASAFGSMLLLIVALCMLWSLEWSRWKRHFLTIAALGAISYLLVCPFLPPSLIGIMRVAAQFHNDGWSLTSLAPLAGLALAWSVAHRLLTRFQADPPLRIFTFFALVTIGIAATSVYLHRQFVPQPGRYKVDLEMAFALFIVFAVRPLLRRQSTAVRVSLALLLLSVGVEQVISHRRFARKLLEPVDITKTIEYRISKWAELNLAGQRIMTAGTMSQWLNTFTGMQEFSGSSWSTAQNPVEQIGLNAIVWGEPSFEGERDIPLLWLTAYGAQAVMISGPQSPEFWKTFKNPRRFDGHLDVLWREEDTTIYRVPQRTASFAHAMPEGSIVRDAPKDHADVAQITQYVRSLKDETLPAADFRWDGYNRAIIRANTRGNDVVSVQVTYHPGWHATVNGKSAKVMQDGLGLIRIKPNVAGPCEIQLHYNGGLELIACRIVSLLALAGVIAGYIAMTQPKRKVYGAPQHASRQVGLL